MLDFFRSVCPNRMTIAESTVPRPPGSRREVFAWVMYDWSSSAYSTLLITVVMMYIKSVLVPGRAGPAVYAWTISGSMLLAAVLSPIVGALADAGASKRWWLAATALAGSLASASLFVVPYERAWLAVGLIFFMSLCFELSLTFYNGFLPEITNEETINRVSGYGYALGYLGGSLPLVLAIGVLLKGAWIGLPDGNKLTMDFASTPDAEFAVDVPAGRYTVRVALGDPASERGPMRVFINRKPAGRITTAVGQSRVVEQVTEVEDRQPLRVRVTGDAKSPAEAAVQGIEVLSADGRVVLRFDFGTRGSAVEDGYLWVLDRDTYRKWTVAELEKRGLAQDQRRSKPGAKPRLRLPADGAVSFGWQRGRVTTYDAVSPRRLQWGLLILGLWWGLFSIPTIVILRDRGLPPEKRERPARAIASAIHKVGQTLISVRRYHILFIFLVGFLFLNDGVQTVISQAGNFASEELGFGLSDLIALILMIQMLALPGALVVGYAADHLGRKRTLVICLLIWIALVLAAYFVTTKLEFWIMGAVLAMVMGGTQAVSRAIMGIMTPEAHSAEFFGFFNFSGKATSWMGTGLFGVVIYVTQSAQLAIVSVLIFFIIGLVLIAQINVLQGRREAHARESPSPP